ncbi:3-keto-5-aminohexanoate cleavage protein [Burkholderia alba]|uniref:3-keto-5-aminohexanoate cleavage protein n=1 Tax=Burkholderia alba TaxID=2683677 RepID=UPI002B05D55D|nr:3-keto-5-aminohexanoate cleavage protein [Burkholderia alba]
MTKTFYITAAPVGAVPKFLDPLEPKFIPLPLLGLLGEDARQATCAALEANGWEAVPAGGIALEHGFDELVDLSAAPLSHGPEVLAELGWVRDGNTLRRPGSDAPAAKPFVIARAVFEHIESRDLVRQLVLQLTTFGWVVTDDGDLAWPHDRVHSYLPPSLVEPLRDSAPVALDALLAAGWRSRGAGFWQPGKARSPYLPITADGIVEASRHALREGAAVVHLHTRATDDQQQIRIPGLNAAITTGAQRNHIVVDDYDRIVPRLIDLEPAAILNLSTSARGDRRASESPLRRAHLKRYGHAQIAPDVASFSPGPVVFQGGGGYDNPHGFLARQLEHFAEFGVRPEIEVFNHTIVQNSTTLYRTVLEQAGAPVLFMLVAAVDQYHRDPVSGETDDDSLIDVPSRKAIAKLLQADEPSATAEAVRIAVEKLRPCVDELRESFPSCRISLLLPGPFQAILADVAIGLDLDGIRVGLEDALNVFDARAPGGVRKACGTGDQVRALRLDLERRGIAILDAEALRDDLGMPRPDITLFRRAEAALKRYPAEARAPASLPDAATIVGALQPIVDTYRQREDRLASYLATARDLPATPAALAQVVHTAAHGFGLAIRSFIEELDRYTDHEHLIVGNLDTPQALNFAREILAPRGYSIARYDDALARHARPGETVTHGGISYRVPVEQFKSPELRCLEYLVAIPCRYNGDHSDVVNLVLRQDERYSTTMALLYHALRELTLTLRARSNAHEKAPGPVWTILEASPAGSAPPSRRDAAPDGPLLATGVDWIVLPSTPTTNYPLGLKLSNGLARLFHTFVTQLASDPALRRPQTTPRTTPIRLLGITHAGRRHDGETVVEASMLHNRFALNADRVGDYFGHESQLIYERLILPRLVETPEQLDYTESQLVRRDAAGFPLYRNGAIARRIAPGQIDSLPLVRLFAHSSGIATAQQLDVLACLDGRRLGMNTDELRAFFDRALLVSFGSAADIHLDRLGTSVLDITAFNDVRSVAGTTNRHYVLTPGAHTDILQESFALAQPAEYRYEHAVPVWRQGAQGKTVALLTGVFLLDDAARLDDGHSIRRYLSASPLWLRQWISLIHHAPAHSGAQAILRELQTPAMRHDASANQTTRKAIA